MNDFRDNFGNFSACFALETQHDVQPNQGMLTDRFGNSLEEHKGGAGGLGGHMWQGNISVSKEDPIQMSTFHQELNSYAASEQ